MDISQKNIQCLDFFDSTLSKTKAKQEFEEFVNKVANLDEFEKIIQKWDGKRVSRGFKIEIGLLIN